MNLVILIGGKYGLVELIQSKNKIFKLIERVSGASALIILREFGSYALYMLIVIPLETLVNDNGKPIFLKQSLYVFLNIILIYFF